MNLIESLPHKLGSPAPWIEKGGVLWLDPDTLSVRELCIEMNVAKARFVTITAYQLPGTEGLRLEYHWDINGELLGFPFKLPPIPSKVSTTYAKPPTGLNVRSTKNTP